MTKYKFLKTVVICLAASGLLASTESSAMYGIVNGGMNVDKPKDSASAATYGGLGGVTAGGMLGVGWLPFFDFEFGAYSLKRSFFTGNYTQSSTWIEVPALVRLWAIPMFGVGAGVYGAKATGTVQIDSPNYTGQATFDSVNLKATDVGFMASVIWQPPMIPFALVEGRYSQSLISSDTRGGSFKYTDMLILVGFKIGLLGTGK